MKHNSIILLHKKHFLNLNLCTPTKCWQPLATLSLSLLQDHNLVFNFFFFFTIFFSQFFFSTIFCFLFFHNFFFCFFHYFFFFFWFLICYFLTRLFPPFSCRSAPPDSPAAASDQTPSRATTPAPAPPTTCACCRRELCSAGGAWGGEQEEGGHAPLPGQGPHWGVHPLWAPMGLLIPYKTRHHHQ